MTAALKFQIEELKKAREQIIQQSPVHCVAYERFYFSSKKKTDQAIAEHLAGIAEQKTQNEYMAKEIRTLKTLRPWLEDRHEFRLLEFGPRFSSANV